MLVPSEAVVPARAALAGNPSDGHGGAVLAIAVPQLAATVVSRDAAPDDGEPALVRAARASFASAGHTRAKREPAIEVTTTIPREVGLAGSSAIVVGVLRVLCAWHDVTLGDVELAALALHAEQEGLGIAAGPQDRLAQACGGCVLMELGRDPWEVRAIDPAGAGGLYVAWLTDAGQPSGEWHARLRERPASEVAGVMDELAALAREATGAIEAGDRAALARCVDGTLALRERLGPLDPAHAALAQRARAVGLSANFTGSGGAVVGTYDNQSQVELLRANLTCVTCIT